MIEFDLFGDEIVEEETFDEEEWAENYKKLQKNKYSPFDFGNDLSFTKRNILESEGYSEECVKNLKNNLFMINRIFSQYPDTILWANEMNQAGAIDPIALYNFYFYGIKRKKRFAKWGKPKKQENIDVVMEFLGYSRRAASMVVDLYTKEDIKDMKKRLDKGGKK